jgi:hypothetical protein
VIFFLQQKEYCKQNDWSSAFISDVSEAGRRPKLIGSVQRRGNIFTLILKEDMEIEKPVYGFMKGNGGIQNNCWSEKGVMLISF